MRKLTREDIEQDQVNYHERGDAPPLVPVVTQDAATGSILMLAWADKEALQESLQSGDMHYFSRSRGRLWRKGEESGNTQRLLSLYADCDRDTLLAVVEQKGPACHTGAATCFHDDTKEPVHAGGILGELSALIADRDEKRPEGSHTTALLEDENLRLKKVQEEAGELLVALAKNDQAAITAEAADLLYHTLVALQGAGVRVEDVLDRLQERRG